MLLTSATTTTEYPSVILAAKVLDYVDKLRNAEVTEPLVKEITAYIRDLIYYCNTKHLELPVDVVYKPCNIFPTEIKSWYQPNLNLTNIQEFILSTFKELGGNSYYTKIETSNRCIDALRVLVDYTNVVVLWRINRYLELQEKKLDESQSSKSVETSIHLDNGDDFYG